MQTPSRTVWSFNVWATTRKGRRHELDYPSRNPADPFRWRWLLLWRSLCRGRLGNYSRNHSRRFISTRHLRRECDPPAPTFPGISASALASSTCHRPALVWQLGEPEYYASPKFACKNVTVSASIVFHGGASTCQERRSDGAGESRMREICIQRARRRLTGESSDRHSAIAWDTAFGALQHSPRGRVASCACGTSTPDGCSTAHEMLSQWPEQSNG